MRQHLLLLLGFVALAGVAMASSPWPDDHSDLPPDPTVRAGILPNGVRYRIRPNAEPKDRVSIRLVVLAGSLHERDDEQGLAHFVEHMAFRGTRRHPGDTLPTELQRRGIAFGPNLTAFTFFDHTQYHLDLPDGTEASLRFGLSVLREYAEELTFEPALIERERGVVLAERDTRNTPDARVANANLAFLWPESRQSRRLPIGTIETIRQFTREQCVEFYNAWYRPDRMAVVIVGDIEPEEAERVVAEMLTGLTGRGLPREDPPAFEPAAASTPDVMIVTDAGLVGASCFLQHPFVDPSGPDTRERRIAQLHRALAFSMLQRRTSRLAEANDQHPISPTAAVAALVPGWSVASLGGTGKITEWAPFMVGLEQEHRRAFLYGFTAEELQTAKLTLATACEEAVRTAPTWPSGWMADQMVAALVQGRPFATPLARQADLTPVLEATTPAQCLAAFREAWTTKPPHVFIATHPAFRVAPEEIAAALNVSRSQPVERPTSTPVPAFGYGEFGPRGQPTKEIHIDDLAIDQARFANGVRLNFKHTDFEADSVNVVVRVGRGRLSQPRALPGLDLLANQLIPRGGLGRHSYLELQDILNGHRINASFAVQSDALEFRARCAPGDLPLCLGVITAHLIDTAYRAEAMRHVHATFGTLFANLGSSASGPISLHATRIVAGGDDRFGIPAADELMRRTIPELKAWIEPELKHGAIELSIVGDIAWEGAREAVARTLAALPRRDPETLPPGPGPVGVAKSKKLSYVFTTAPQLRQVALVWMIPVRDLGDMHHERRCVMLAELLAERIRRRLREGLGATYACSAELVDHDGFPQLSYFNVFAEVAPEHARTANEAIRKEIETLRKGRFDEDEFQRIRLPFLRRREEDLRHNVYWAHTVLRDAQQRPERLDAARDRATDTAAITRRDLQALARRYFDPGKCFQFVSYPAVSRPGVTRPR